MQTKTMRAIVAKGYGGPEVLEVQEVAIPQVGDHEILVRVISAAITTADGMMRTGKPYVARLFTGLKAPKYPIPGTGFSGEVVAIGAQVSRFQIGELVFGESSLNFSASAQFLKISEEAVVLAKPDSLSHEEAAVLCDGPLTSYNFLIQIAQLKAGQKILINGAAGALGVAAVQIAKYYGAQVTAIASAHNAPKLLNLGADKCIDYHEKDFLRTKEKYDIVYDAVGKISFSEAKQVLKPTSLYLSPVLSFPLLVDTFCSQFFRSNQQSKFSATGMLKEHQLRNMLEEVLKIHQAGALKIPIDRQYPLEKLAEAHGFMTSGKKKFNLVLRVA